MPLTHMVFVEKTTQSEFREEFVTDDPEAVKEKVKSKHLKLKKISEETTKLSFRVEELPNSKEGER